MDIGIHSRAERGVGWSWSEGPLALRPVSSVRHKSVLCCIVPERSLVHDSSFSQLPTTRGYWNLGTFAIPFKPRAFELTVNRRPGYLREMP
jgi:hypothetical protein